jgi:hypothetical protein
LAQSGHPDTLDQCPLLGVKRTSAEGDIGDKLPLLPRDSCLLMAPPEQLFDRHQFSGCIEN